MSDPHERLVSQRQRAAFFREGLAWARNRLELARREEEEAIARAEADGERLRQALARQPELLGRREEAEAESRSRLAEAADRAKVRAEQFDRWSDG